MPGVSSITIDPHKMGMSTIPAGGLLFRGQECLSALETETHYLTKARQASLTGTRSGAAAAATYAVMMHLGREGFKEIVDYCMDLTHHLVAGAREIGIQPAIEPIMNVVALQVPSPAEVREELMKQGLACLHDPRAQQSSATDTDEAYDKEKYRSVSRRLAGYCCSMITFFKIQKKTIESFAGDTGMTIGLFLSVL